MMTHSSARCGNYTGWDLGSAISGDDLRGAGRKEVALRCGMTIHDGDDLLRVNCERWESP